MNFIGIDNGLSGAIAVIRENGLFLYDIPVTKVDGKKKYDIIGISGILKENCNKDSMVILEKAQAFPGQGVVSMFSIGYGFGLMQGILTTLCVNYDIVTPQQWKKKFGLIGTDKNACVPVAESLFQNCEFRTKRGKMIDGRGDAALLAEYGRRTYSGIFGKEVRE